MWTPPRQTGKAVAALCLLAMAVVLMMSRMQSFPSLFGSEMVSVSVRGGNQGRSSDKHTAVVVLVEEYTRVSSSPTTSPTGSVVVEEEQQEVEEQHEVEMEAEEADEEEGDAGDDEDSDDNDEDGEGDDDDDGDDSNDDGSNDEGSDDDNEEAAEPETESPTRPTQSPTLMSRQKCLKRVLAPPPTRNAPDWLGECTPGIPAHALDDVKVRKLNKSTQAQLDRVPVHYLSGQKWGGLCNQLSMLAGMLRNLSTATAASKTTPQRRILAFNSIYSEPFWALDMHALTSHNAVFGVLMDCNGCDEEVDDQRFLRCRTLVVRGARSFDVSHRIFRVFQRSHVVNLYHLTRPKEVGFTPQLNTMVQPHRAVAFLVRRALARANFFSTANSTTRSVSIHQRAMDGQWKWLANPYEYNCHPKFNLTDLFLPMGITAEYNENNGRYEHITQHVADEFKVKEGDDEDDDAMMTITDEFERRFPLSMTCNYSLSDNQLSLLRKHFPVMFSRQPPGGGKRPPPPRTWRILLGTDGQSPAATATLRRAQIDAAAASSTTTEVHMLSELEPCLAKLKYHDMLADMVAMSLTDFHLANPISSCDDIVAHWRIANGEPKGTSFPPGCYDGYWSEAAAAAV